MIVIGSFRESLAWKYLSEKKATEILIFRRSEVTSIFTLFFFFLFQFRDCRTLSHLNCFKKKKKKKEMIPLSLR